MGWGQGRHTGAEQEDAQALQHGFSSGRTSKSEAELNSVPLQDCGETTAPALCPRAHLRSKTNLRIFPRAVSGVYSRHFPVLASASANHPRRKPSGARFEIQDWRPLEHVDAADVEPRAIPAHEFDYGQADGIRTVRRTRGEHAVRTIVAGRRAHQLEAFRAIEHPQHEQVREAFDVGEAFLEFRENFQIPFGVVFRSQSSGNFAGFLVWTSYVTDRPHGKHSDTSLESSANCEAAIDFRSLTHGWKPRLSKRGRSLSFSASCWWGVPEML